MVLLVNLHIVIINDKRKPFGFLKFKIDLNKVNSDTIK